MKHGFARNTDLESVRPAELHSAKPEGPDLDVRWPHRQPACVPITRASQLTIDQRYRSSTFAPFRLVDVQPEPQNLADGKHLFTK